MGNPLTRGALRDPGLCDPTPSASRQTKRCGRASASAGRWCDPTPSASKQTKLRQVERLGFDLGADVDGGHASASSAPASYRRSRTAAKTTMTMAYPPDEKG